MTVQDKKAATHVIFDFAGTIIDFNHLIENICKGHIKSLNIDVPESYFEKIPECNSPEEAFEEFYNSFGLENSMSYVNFKRDCWSKLVKIGLVMRPGVEKLLKHLYENNIPIAIATNLDKTNFKGLVDTTIGWDSKYLSHYVCGADDPEVSNNKPAPDIFLVCAQRFNPPPKSMDSCVVFEDSIRGITGAVGAGMRAVLLHKGVVNEDLTGKITKMVDSFDNFKPESVGLPPYPGCERGHSLNTT